MKSTNIFRSAALTAALAAGAGLFCTGDARAQSPSEIKKQIAEVEAQIKSLTQPAQWVMTTGSGEVKSGTAYRLCNDQSKECLGYKKQGSGIDLSWHGAGSDYPAKMVKPGGGTIKYGDSVAIFVGTSDNSFLCYEKRSFGINIVWRKAACHEWKVVAPPGAADGQPLTVGAPFKLNNTVVKDDMVRCARTKSGGKGAWLKWGRDCSTAELLYTNKGLVEPLAKKLAELKKKL
jgi:hypothetical protein